MSTALANHKAVTVKQAKRKRLDIALHDLIKENKALSELKVYVYKKAWLVEQAYRDEYEEDMKFREMYPRFKEFMFNKVPTFDYLDYLKYKPLIVLDKQDTLFRISNSALDLMRSKLVKLSTGEVNPKAIDIISQLPKGEMVITIDDVWKVLDKNKIQQKVKVAGAAPRLRVEPKYTKDELNGMTKNDLIDLTIKLQSALRRAKKING